MDTGMEIILCSLPVCGLVYSPPTLPVNPLDRGPADFFARQNTLRTGGACG